MKEAKKDIINDTYHIYCEACNGIGKKNKKVSKQKRQAHQASLEKHLISTSTYPKPIRLIGETYKCETCLGTGIVIAKTETKPDTENLPHIAIIGSGIAGAALAVACLHRKIPFTLFERDENFNSRKQGYGLTLQQASKIIAAFGIGFLPNTITSTKHIVHKTNGEIIGEWGIRKWQPNNSTENNKRKNIHLPRQALRMALLNIIPKSSYMKWNHKFIGVEKQTKQDLILTFKVNEEIKKYESNLVVGADGIRSSVRKIILGDKPLNYLGYMVILGICNLDKLNHLKSDLLDSETVFQTANGVERIYMMPFNKNAIMWQLSFPMTEENAKKLSINGANALKKEAIKRTQWHSPIPQIVSETEESEISGYPVYDRNALEAKQLENANNITLIGDAAHPMSPFKGQGANQALLDALSLARKIQETCQDGDFWKKEGLRKKTLSAFELEMLQRSTKKVKDSAKAAEYLHSETVLIPGNETRGNRNIETIKSKNSFTNRGKQE